MEMRKQIGPIWTWLVLISFLAFSICLPLGHVCLNHGSYANQLSAQPLAQSYLSGYVQDKAWHAGSVDENHNRDICQACLLGQNLLE